MYDFLLVASLGVFAAVLIVYLRQPVASLVHPATWYLAFHGFIFVIRPIVARVLDFRFVYEVYRFEPSMADKITVILAANLALLAFMAVSLRIAAAPPLETAHGTAAEGDSRARLFAPIVIALTLLLPLAIASQAAKWTAQNTADNGMVMDPSAMITVNTSANGWFVDASLMLAPMAVILVWLSRYRWWGWLALALFALSQAGTGGRAAMVYALAGVGMIYLLETRRRWFDWRLVMLGAAGLLLFNTVVQDRGARVRALIQDDVGAVQRSDETLKPLEHMDFANLEYFEYIVYVVPQRSGSWDYFAHNLQILTEPIPRVLWKDKPVGSPVKFFRLWDYGTPIGMTASVPGTGWMAFGWLGVIVQAALFAGLYSALYMALVVRRTGILTRMAYVLVLGTSIVTFRDGTLLTFLRVQPFYLGPWLLIAGLARLQGVGRGPVVLGAPPPTAAAPSSTPAQRRAALAAQWRAGGPAA